MADNNLHIPKKPEHRTLREVPPRARQGMQANHPRIRPKPRTRGYVDNRASPTGCAFPVSLRKNGEMLTFAHIPTGAPRPQPKIFKMDLKKEVGAKPTPLLATESRPQASFPAQKHQRQSAPN